MKHGNVLSLTAFLWVVACSSGGDSDRGVVASVEQHRDYSYHIGEVIPIVYELDLAGNQLDPQSLSYPRTVEDWLYLRRLTDLGATGGDENKHRIRADYQIFKGLKEAEELEIPPMTFRLKDPSRPSIKTPAWKFVLLPVIPPGAQNEDIDPQEGLSYPKRDQTPYLERTQIWVGMCGLVLLLFAVRRSMLSKMAAPFRAARSSFARGLQSGSSADQRAAGFRALHHAFNQTHGATLFQNDVERFVRRHPSFRGIEAYLDLFFTHSTRIFFDSTATVDLIDQDRERLSSLLNRCIRAEKAAQIRRGGQG